MKLLLKRQFSTFQSPDNKFVASGALDGIINVFDVDTGKLVHTLEGHGKNNSLKNNLIWWQYLLIDNFFIALPIRSLTFSQNSQLLLTASDDGQIKIYDV